jgi:hypothetical protein
VGPERPQDIKAPGSVCCQCLRSAGQTQAPTLPADGIMDGQKRLLVVCKQDECVGKPRAGRDRLRRPHLGNIHRQKGQPGAGPP